MSDNDRVWLTGNFLISDADMPDPNFQRTVILLISHDVDGAFGLVINRRIEATLGDAIPAFAHTGAASIPLYEGGPVEQKLLFAIQSGFPGDLRSEAAIDPVAHVTFEPSFQVLSSYLMNQWAELHESERPPIRLYAGYSGWSPGQLENELRLGTWIVRPAAAKHIFSDDPDEGWRHALGELGGMYRIVAETGYKPSMN